jgi:type III pantothenate kinase
MIERTQHELGRKISVVATGGLSQVIAPLSKHIQIVEPLLTLNGLVEINWFCK